MNEDEADYAPPPPPVDPVFQAIGAYAEIWIGKTADNEDIYTVPDKFYFWDETWAYAHGPFDTADEARIGLDKYCHWLTTGEE